MKLISKYSYLFIFIYFVYEVMLHFNSFGFFIGDLGRELYSPTRLLYGQIPYLDFHWLYGPFTIYIKFLLYYLFGTSLYIPLWESIIVSFITVIIAYKLSRKFLSPLLSTLLIIIYMKIAMFGYTWQSLILPGKYATLWGNLFSLFLIYLITNEFRQVKFFSVGILLGLLFITKVDYFIASSIAVLFFLALNFKTHNKSIILTLTKLMLGFLIPTIPFAVYFLIFNNVPIQTIVNNVLPSYSSSFWFNNRSFYDLKSFSQSLLVNSSGIVIILLLAIQGYKKRRVSNAIKIIAVATLLFINKYFINEGTYLFTFFQSLYLLSVIIVLLLTQIRSQSNNKFRYLILILIFETVLNLRNKLALSSFDFIYPLLILISGVLFLTSSKNKNIIFNKKISYIALVVLLLVLSFKQIKYLNIAQFNSNDLKMQTKKGVVYTEKGSSNEVLLKTADYIQKKYPDSSTLTSFPMEVSLNYFTDRINPTYYDQYVNGIVSPLDEDKIIKDLEYKKPDIITVSNYSFIGTFGLDYNKKIYQWIINNYKKEIEFGCTSPFDTSTCSGYGIQVLSSK